MLFVLSKYISYVRYMTQIGIPSSYEGCVWKCKLLMFAKLISAYVSLWIIISPRFLLTNLGILAHIYIYSPFKIISIWREAWHYIPFFFPVRILNHSRTIWWKHCLLIELSMGSLKKIPVIRFKSVFLDFQFFFCYSICLLIQYNHVVFILVACY